MKQTRRSILGAAGALIAGTAGASYVLADSHLDIEIEVHAEDEYVVLMNAGDEEINLTGHYIDFEHQGGDTQVYPDSGFPEGTVLAPGEDFVVATGYKDVSDADYNVGLNQAQLHNTEPDVVALLGPDGETEIATQPYNTTTTTTTTTEDDGGDGDGGDGDGGDGDGSDGDGDGGDGGEEQPTASVTFEDQETDGSSVVVQHTSLSDGGYIVIHDESGAVLDHSAYLDAGDHSNEEISLDAPITESQTLIAMPHTDDGDQTYEFPDADGPYTADGGPVTDSASITVC